MSFLPELKSLLGVVVGLVGSYCFLVLILSVLAQRSKIVAKRLNGPALLLLAAISLGAFIASLAISSSQAITLRLSDVVSVEPFYLVLESLSWIGLYLDRVSLIMLAFISFVGLAVSRFAFRYLDGEPQQARFMSLLGAAIASGQLLVISGNLALFALFWIALSVCFHRLLEHYASRPRAILAARKKFIISRLGDLFLLVAIIALFNKFETLDIQALFAIAKAPLTAEELATFNLATLGILGAALCKSAQFPFHTWLPDTLEAPTPVSALMHAGIVNGGGYALIRFSPLFTHGELALTLAVIFGSLTATIGVLVMWSQTNIKKSLAWSTVAQMGFMMLQCGLGAFGLVLMHILGHGFYKAHAFMISGTRAQVLQPQARTESLTAVVAKLLLGVIAAIIVVSTSANLLGINLSTWPGGFVSVVVLVLGLAQMMVPKFEGNSADFAVRVALLCLIGFLAVSLEQISTILFASNLASVAPLSSRGGFEFILAITVVLNFTALGIFSAILPQLSKTKFGLHFFAHAVNGFYIGLYADRLIRKLWPQRREGSVSLDSCNHRTVSS